MITMIQRPTEPKVIRTRCQELASKASPPDLSRGAIGSLKGALNNALKDIANAYQMTPDEARHMVMGWLFGEPEPIGSERMTMERWFAIEQWVGPYKDEADGKWKSHPAFATEALWCFNAARWADDPRALPTEGIEAPAIPGAVVTAAWKIEGEAAPKPAAKPAGTKVIVRSLPPSYRKGRPVDL